MVKRKNNIQKKKYLPFNCQYCSTVHIGIEPIYGPHNYLFCSSRCILLWRLEEHI